MQIANAFGVDDNTLEVTPIVAPKILTLAERAGLDELVSSRLPEQGRKPVSRSLSPAEAPGEDLVHRFIPIWDARAEAIGAYRCIVDPAEPGTEPATPNGKARAALKLALATLNISVAALEGALRGASASLSMCACRSRH
jgi:hypothetical protein